MSIMPAGRRTRALRRYAGDSAESSAVPVPSAPVLLDLDWSAEPELRPRDLVDLTALTTAVDIRRSSRHASYCGS